MLRAAAIVTLATAFGAALFAQSRDRGFGRSTSDWCGDQGDRDRAYQCEVREDTIGGANPVEIDAGRNGGIRVRGWDRGDVLVRSRIVAHADTDTEARRIVSGIRIETAGGTVRAA